MHAGACEHLPKFAADKTTPNHEQRCWEFVQFHRTRAVQPADAVDAWDSWSDGRRACRNDAPIRLDKSAVDSDSLCRKPCAILDVGNRVVLAQHVDVLALTQR